MLKRIVNLVVSMFVGTTDWVSTRLGRLFGRSQHGTCVVLAYHSVLSKQREQFARQMDTLLRQASPIRADVKSLPEPNRHYAAVTFDDGLANILENALPELKKRSIPATLFIVTDVLGGNPGWEYFGGDNPAEQIAMTEQQLRELPSDLVLIGSHTMTHPVLPAIDREKVREELVGSRSKLEKIVNQDVKLFSFPYGAFNDSVVESCREANYDRVFTALPVFAFSQSNEFVTGRVGVNPTDWPIEFRLKVAGAYRWLPYAFVLKRKILSGFRRKGSRPVGLESGEKRVA